MLVLLIFVQDVPFKAAPAQHLQVIEGKIYSKELHGRVSEVGGCINVLDTDEDFQPEEDLGEHQRRAQLGAQATNEGAWG